MAISQRNLHGWLPDDAVDGKSAGPVWALMYQGLRELAQHAGNSDIQREQIIASRPTATCGVVSSCPSRSQRVVETDTSWKGLDCDAAPGRAKAFAVRLAGRYPQNWDQPFDRILVLRIVGVAVWAAGPT